MRIHEHFCFFATALFLFSATVGFSIAQQEEAAGFSRDAVYFEVLGQGLLYSVNYDHRFTPHLGLRAGLTYWEFWLFTVDGVAAAPIMFTYLTGHGNRHFELGLGVVPGIIARGEGNFFGLDIPRESNRFILGTATIGYRSQPEKGGFLFRIGLTPLFNFKWARVIFGISFGYAFGPRD